MKAATTPLTGIRYLFKIIILVISVPGFSQENPSPRQLLDKPAPELEYVQLLNDMDESTINQFEGRITVLNFWAKWCSPCIKEMKSLEKFHNKHADGAIMLMGITGHYRSYENADTVKSLGLIQKIIAKQAVTYPVLIDRGYANWNAYNAHTLPLTLLIDQQGDVVDYGIGIKQTKKILSKAEKMLE